MIHEKNLQPTELKFYISNTARCLDIVVLLYSRIQNHHFNTLIMCSTIFTSLLYTNHNNIQQSYDLHQTFRSLYNTNPVFSLSASSLTNTISGYIENITISTEPTTKSPSNLSYVTQNDFVTIIKELKESLKETITHL